MLLKVRRKKVPMSQEMEIDDLFQGSAYPQRTDRDVRNILQSDGEMQLALSATQPPELASAEYEPHLPVKAIVTKWDGTRVCNTFQHYAFV